MSSSPEIVDVFNKQGPDKMPLDSLPVSYICNFDQSQKSVEPIANRTPKETGECVVKTGGKEKE